MPIHSPYLYLSGRSFLAGGAPRAPAAPHEPSMSYFLLEKTSIVHRKEHDATTQSVERPTDLPSFACQSSFR